MPDYTDAEGIEIAKELGVKYEGPQFRHENEFFFYVFTDTVTLSTFGARDIVTAKKALSDMRASFKKYHPDTHIDKSWWDANYFDTDEDGERLPCVIRTDASLDEAVKHLGYSSKSVDLKTEKSLAGVVMTDVELLEDSQRRLSGVRPLSDDSLNKRQRAHLELARAVTNELTNKSGLEVCAGIIPGASDRTRTAGLYSRLEPKIYISQDQLENGKASVDVSVHEASHHTSQREDGEPEHEVEIKRNAAKVVELVSAGKFDQYIRNTDFVW